jgi:MFS family permease
VTFYGWRVVAGAFVVLCLAYGTQYSFGIFFAALLDEFGWSRAGLSGVFSLYVFAYTAFGFAAGRLTDRWGPRAVITAGGVCLGSALAGMALVTRLWEPYLLYGVVAALGMGTAYVPCNSTVVKWFVRRRGLAMGIATSGASVGNTVLPPLAHALVAGVGWRAAYVTFGVAVGVLLVLVARVMRRDPESMGLRPDGAGPPTTGPAAATPATAGWTLGSALRTPTFWLLGVAFSATWLPVFVPIVHLVSFVRDLGHPPATGAWMISALGIGAIAGRLVMGPLSDRLGRKATIAIAMAMQALAFLGFLAFRDLALLFAAAVVFGYSYGTITTLFPAIVGDLFGREQAGSLVGFLFMLAGSISAWGTLGAGAIHDAAGGYDLVWVGGAALNLAAVAFLAACRPPRRLGKAAGGC